MYIRTDPEGVVQMFYGNGAESAIPLLVRNAGQTVFTFGVNRQGHGFSLHDTSSWEASEAVRLQPRRGVRI